MSIGFGPRLNFTALACSLALASRAHAFLAGRGYVVPGDIKAIAMEVLRHRVMPTYEAEAEGLSSDTLVARVLETVPVP